MQQPLDESKLRISIAKELEESSVFLEVKAPAVPNNHLQVAVEPISIRNIGKKQSCLEIFGEASRKHSRMAK